MCLICVEFQKGKLSVLEAFQNASEMEETLSEEHYEEVINMLTKEWETQSYLESQEDQDDLNDDQIYSKVEPEEFDEPWGEFPEYGNFDDSI